MSRFIEHKTEELFKLHDNLSGYTLKSVKHLTSIKWTNIFFSAPLNEYDKYNQLMITPRNMKHYDLRIQKMELNKDNQYLEVGAGLGEFVSYLYKKMPNLEKKPIVIDPANYAIMYKMLVYLRKIANNESSAKNLDILIERCSIILDPDKTQLYNMTLLEAMVNYPELKKSADAVLDNQGACIYPKTESEKLYSEENISLKILSAEKELLKPDGLLIYNNN